MTDRRHLTIAAIATPVGRGGVGIVRLSGDKAYRIGCKLAAREQVVARHATLCHWYDDEHEVIDAGVMLYFAAPSSYTGEDVVELQAHGSPVLLRALLEQCIQYGCVLAEPGEFTRRALLHGKLDLSQAEAVVACIDAETERAARQAQKQLQGNFGKKIEALMDKTTGIVAHVEACLDFPEEEIPELFLEELSTQLEQSLIQPMQQLLATASFGERLFQGVSVAIIGAPNVGKSSLLNALSGRERAIVSDIAGTTRDTLEVDFEIHGIPVRLVDTAGLRDSNDSIEQEGVRRAQQAAALADLVIFVADASRPETWQTEQAYDIAVMNKLDLQSQLSHQDNFMAVSVKQQQGLSEFIDSLALLLGEEPTNDEVYITSQRHRLAVEQAQRYVQKAVPLLHDEATLDLAALHLRKAWSSLGEILGVGDVEYILDRIFSEFCIGK